MSTDGVGYRERLWPSPGVWLAGAGFGAAFGLVALPFGRVPGVLAAVLGVAVVALLLARTATVVEVRDGELRAGRARLPLAVAGAVTPLDRARMRHENGVGLDARAYLCLRGWVPGGVRVELSDPADPAPYWLVSSRHPAELARAAGTARAK